MRRVVPVLAVLVVVAVVLALDGRHSRSDGSTSSGSPSTPVATAPAVVPSPTVGAELALPATASPSPSPSGEALARAWLTSFLTRPDRDDVGWVVPVGRLSTPDLVDQLCEDGPELVGLDELNTWRVVSVRPFTAVHEISNTATRHALAYTATVTDDAGHTKEKPFVLYAFRQPSGAWLVGLVEQPYSSEG